jgi:predicted RND superfamily exporter protein
MWIKLALIIAILCSAGVIVLSETKLKETLTKLNEAREEKAKKLDEMTKEKEKFAKQAGDRQQQLDTMTADRDSEKGRAEKALTDLNAEKVNVAKAIADAAAAKSETASVKAEAKEFFDYGKKMAEVKIVFAELPVVKQELDVTKEERKIISVRMNRVQGDLDAIKNVGKEVVMHDSIKGRIVMTDPKWEFVIVNVGGNHGVLRNGELLVNRAGKFIGRLKVATVEPNHSIANVMQQWKKKGEEVQEGDEVSVP